MRALLAFILCFIAYVSFGQIGLAKRALKHLEKGEVADATDLVNKALEKDSLFPAALYTKSRIFLDTANNHPDIDSAYYFILQAQSAYERLEEKELKKHQQAGIDPLAFEKQKKLVDSAAYERAAEVNSEESYIYFIDHFKTAGQLKRAIRLRNALAYESARAENTYQSYRQFMEKYPKATQVTEAKRRYEKLYFDKSTSDGKLKSYLKFLKDNPDTPYRSEAEENIYEVMTADNSARSYLTFIRQFPKSKIRGRAINFLYHVLREQESDFPKGLLSDSLQYIIKLDGSVLLPIMEEGRYGFIDAEGNEVIKPVHAKIFADELCGGIDRNYLLLENQIIGLDGALIYQGKYDAVEDLGYGLLKVVQNGKTGIVHKSGRKLLPLTNEEVRLLHGRFIAFKRKGLWGLRTISGREIAATQFDNIFTIGPFVIFEKDDRLDVKNDARLVQSVDNNGLDLSLKFDDFELINEEQLWVGSPVGEAIIDRNMDAIIAYRPQKIKILKHGFVLEKDGQVYLLNNNYRPVEKEPAAGAKISDAWIALEGKDGWELFNNKMELRSVGLDSVQMLGSTYVLAYKHDSTAIVTLDRPWLLSPSERVFLVQEANSDPYLVIEGERKRKRVINKYGEEICSGTFDEVKPLGKGYLVISKNGKKGMISNFGESLLKQEYDAIGNYDQGFVSLLKNRKFGLYHKDSAVFIPPVYDKNLSRYSARAFVAERDQRKALVDKENEHLSEFVYTDIQYWSDSVALMRQGTIWQLFNFKSQYIVQDNVKSVHVLFRNNEETVAVFLKDSGYGVWSSIRGEIISPTYNDIINVGTPEHPVYFTEKHISEAEFYVVIYYDGNGHPIRKQAFEAKDYPMIYCDN